MDSASVCERHDRRTPIYRLRYRAQLMLPEGADAVLWTRKRLRTAATAKKSD